MPSLPNISSFGGNNTLEIRNLDVVDLAADNISCDTFTVNNNLVITGTIVELGELVVNDLEANTITASSITSTAPGSIPVTVDTEFHVNGSIYLLGGNRAFLGDYLYLGILFCVTNTGVGVGTNDPEEDFDVVGNIRASGNLTVDTNTLFVDSTNNRVGIKTLTPTVELDVVGDCNVSGSTFISGSLIVDSNTLFVNPANNRVGINTFAPSEALSVIGNISASGGLTVNSAINSISGGFWGPYLEISGDTIIDTDTLIVNATTNRVGIKNLTPTEALDVTGNVKATGLIVNGDVTIDSTTLKVDSTNNRVGINVATPSAALDVSGDVLCNGRFGCNYSVTPTFDSTHIGYTALLANSANQGSLVSNTVYKVNNGNLVTLPVGVWNIDVMANYTTSTAGTVTITRIALGINSGSGAAVFGTYTVSDNGFRNIQETVSWPISTGTANSWIYKTYNQVLRVTTAIPNFYGVVSTTHTVTAGAATLNLTTNSFVQITRIG